MQLTLRDARDIKGWTLEKLAEESGVHKATISRLESGKTKPLHETVNALEDALGIKHGTLVFHDSSVPA